MFPHLKFATALLVACAVYFASSSASAQDLQRGVRNYLAIMNGQTRYGDLSAQEKYEVLMVIQRMRSSDDSGSAECREAKEEARSAASELEDYARRLMRCAGGGDLEDDCSSEFSRTRSAHDDYESAVSEVQSACD